MSANKILVSRLFNEVLNERKMEIVGEIIHPEYINHNFPGSKGAEAFKNVGGMFITAFPDMKITVEDILEEGDKLATYGYWIGTHNGDFQGISKTGKNVRINYIDVWKVKDGKLHENWIQMDIAGLMHQLGVVK